MVTTSVTPLTDFTWVTVSTISLVFTSETSITVPISVIGLYTISIFTSFPESSTVSTLYTSTLVFLLTVTDLIWLDYMVFDYEIFKTFFTYLTSTGVYVITVGLIGKQMTGFGLTISDISTTCSSTLVIVVSLVLYYLTMTYLLVVPWVTNVISVLLDSETTTTDSTFLISFISSLTTWTTFLVYG